MTSSRYVAVIGTGEAVEGDEHWALAEDVGRGLAEAGAVVVCGGLGGVMAAACRGARGAGGTTVGLLPGLERGEGNPWLTVALPTGLGEARNPLLVRMADVAVAVGGGYGTLSEIAFALRTGKVVVGLRTWELAGDDVVRVDNADAAVAAALSYTTTT